MSPLEENDKMLSVVQQRTEATIQQALTEHRATLLKEIRQMLEEQLAKAATVSPAVNPIAVNRLGKITEDHLMIIAAVLACHFGKRVKVRSARRVMFGGGSNVWSQQGRAAVQASHSSLR